METSKELIEERIKESRLKYRLRREKETKDKQLLTLFQDNRVARMSTHDLFGYKVSIAVKRDEELSTAIGYEVTLSICSPKDQFDKRTAKLLCAQRFKDYKYLYFVLPDSLLTKDALDVAVTIVKREIINKSSKFNIPKNLTKSLKAFYR